MLTGSSAELSETNTVSVLKVGVSDQWKDSYNYATFIS